MTKSKKERFEGELLVGHKGAAVEVPFDPEEKWAVSPRSLWPGRRGHAVQAELNGVRFGSCIVPRSRKFWMLIDEDIQRRAGVEIGDRIRIRIRITVEPHEDPDVRM